MSASPLTTKAAEIRTGLVARLRRAVTTGEDGCGTLPAKESVKVRPVDWHRITRLAREAAALIEQQAAELAEARAEVERRTCDNGFCNTDHWYDRAVAAGGEINAISAAIGSPRFMDPPDGGDVTLAEQVKRMRETLTTAESERDELLREKERHWVGIRECPQEPPGVLCYVAHGRAWFTTASIDKQWGDDWDDAPYEHNAGWPYSEPGVTLTAIAFDAGDLVTPEHEQVNSRWSVQDINAGRTPWLRSSPYGSGTARIMAGATFREFQHALLAAGGTAFTPWPIKEEDALRAEISRLESLAPLSARETARYLEIERRLSALENGPAGLADAHSKSPSASSQSERIAVLEAALSGMVRHAHETRGKSVEDAYAAARAALSQGLDPLGEE